ncbi:MAG: DNA helicase RecQ [Turicibacter sp.]|nr:DNA helicase RecQ [Turicibacter sp.]
MLAQAQQLLQQYFGYPDFREGQKQAIEQVLEGRDTLCIMPTGGGKSIVYQIPALCFSGTTLVVSPLISLMKDQVDTLNQLGIPATYINSSLTISESRERLNNLSSYKLVYVAPERLESPDFVNAITRVEIPLFAIDEAHCISQWGHDFRPSYMNIGYTLARFPKKPIILALTATATSQVQHDISQLLRIPSQQTIMTSFERKNLSFEVLKGEDNRRYLVKFVKDNAHEDGIIYASTRKDVDHIYELLQKQGIKVARYHAGLSPVERQQNQEDFLFDRVNVVVATNAFGMGIDKSNVRYVIHYQLPKNMEGYYQEAGRAGRDGLDSRCIILYSSQDVQVQRFLIDQSTNDPMRKASELEKLQTIVDYCHTEGCFQNYILNYFGEITDLSCGRCGPCTDTRESVDVTVDAQKVLSCVIRMGQRYGKGMVSQVLSGSKNKKIIQFRFHELPTYGLLSHLSAPAINTFMEFLIAGNYLAVEQGEFPLVKMTERGKGVLMGNERVFRKEQATVGTVSKDNPIFEALRALRREIAEEEGVPPFVVFSDKTLQDLSFKLPRTLEDFLDVHGVGQQKLERYGERFLEILNQFDESQRGEVIEIAPKERKPRADNGKTPSHHITLELYKQGKSIKEMAAEREVGAQTIENHLLKCGVENLLDLNDFVPQQFLAQLEEATTKFRGSGLKVIKENLPEEITYFQIKAYLHK